MAGEIVVFAVGFVLAVFVLVRGASVSGGEDDDHDSSDIDVGTGHHGGGHAGKHSLSETINAELSHVPGSGNVRVRSNTPLDQSVGAGRGRHRNRRKSVSCSHCGSANSGETNRCWSCGSSPSSSLSKNSLSAANQRLQKGAADNSYLVTKEDGPRERPVESAAIPTPGEKKTEPYAQTEEKSNDDEIPIFWSWLGLLLGWVDKWKTLTSTHLRSMGVVASITFVFWGISVVYGALQFGPSGFVGLVGASLIAVMTGAVATLLFLVPGRVKTVGLAYPFAFSTLFLPATVIALYEPSFSWLLTLSTTFAAFIIDGIFGPLGLATFLRDTFQLVGEAHLIMWFLVSFPAGWIAGLVVPTARRTSQQVTAHRQRQRAQQSLSSRGSENDD